MLTLAPGPLTASPPRTLNAGQWLPGRPHAAGTGAAVTDVANATPAKYAWGYANRRGWPDGHHGPFRFTPDVDTTRRRLDHDQGYRHGGPVRPAAVYLMAAIADDAHRHPADGCQRSSCPDSPERGE